MKSDVYVFYESSKNQGATNVYINPRSTTTTSMHQECEKISQKEAPYKRVFQKCSVTITLLIITHRSPLFERPNLKYLRPRACKKLETREMPRFFSFCHLPILAKIKFNL